VAASLSARLAVAAALLALAGCASDEVAQPPPASPSPAATTAPAAPAPESGTPAGPRVLQPIPEYEVTAQAWSTWSDRTGPWAWKATFRSDLTAEYSGLSFAARTGEYSAQLPAHVWEQLAGAIAALHLDEKTEPLQSWSPAGAQVFDATTVRLVVRHKQRTWTLQDYAESAPPAVLALEQTVAWAARTQEVQWREKAP
jgi:hypothetical protein